MKQVPAVSLGQARLVGDGVIRVAVEVHFQGKGRSIKNCPAIPAVGQVALNFPSYLWSQPSFQILANQTNRCLTGHAHDSISLGGPKSHSARCTRRTKG